MSVKKEFLYLTKQDVIDTGYSMKDTLAVLDEIYHEKALGNYELPHKIGIHPRPDDYIHAMPCWAKKWETAGIKWCGGFKHNPKDYGLDYINGVIILNDIETGVPCAIMDAAWITAIRTGGKSGLAAKYLARKNAATVAVLACGVQSRRALEAIYLACPQLKQAICWDVFPESAEKFAQEMKAVCPNLEIKVAASVREAMADADIVATGAPVLQEDIAVIEKDMVKPGLLCVSVDLDVLWKKDAVVENFHKYYTDDIPQFYFFRDERHDVKCIPVVPEDLGKMVAGMIPGRESDTENIFAANIGNAFDDMPIARAIYETAKKKGIGRMLPL